MVNRIGGALELIGLRAVILDIRQYGNSGRQIQATNAAIGKSTEKARDASLAFDAALKKNQAAMAASAAAASNAIAAARAFAAAQQAETKAVNELAAAETRLAAARANAAKARPTDARGRFISRAQAQAEVTAAETGVATATAARDAATASMLRNKLAAADYAKAQKLAAAEAVKAAAAQSAADKTRIASNDRLVASQEKLVGLQAGRLKTVTGAAAIAGGVGIAAVGAASIGAASKYQDTLAKIDVLTDATTEQTKELGEEFLRMSKSLPQTPDELGAGAYAVLSSGIKDVNQALKVTELSAKAAAIGLGESKDVARVITSALNAYKGTGLTAAQITDVLVATVKEGSAEADELAQSLGRVIPVASNLGVGIDELGATLAALTNAGLDTSEATTGVLGILNQLQKSTPDAEEALKSVGLTIEGIRRSIQDKGFVATMQDLAVAFQGNTSAIRPLLPEVRGLNAFVSAFIVQGKNASTILGNIRKEGGITERAFDQMSKTFSFQKDLLKNQLNVALIQIGTAILPTVTAALKDLITWIDKNQESIKSFITQGLKLAIEIIKDFATGIGLIINALSWLPANEHAITVAVGAIGIAFAWALPGGAILKGLTAIIAAVAFLNKEGNKFSSKEFFENTESGKANQEKLRDQLKGGGSIEKAIKDAFAQGGGKSSILDNFAKAIIEDFKTKGFKVETPQGLEEFDKGMGRLNGEFEQSNIEVPKITRNVGEMNTEVSKAQKELQKLAQDFQKSSEAAAEVESIAEKLKLFGDVNKKLAASLGLNAIQAGNIQGVDAVIRAFERADNEAFEFSKTLATVAQAFTMSASVAKDIVLQLARSALEASQAAANAVFSRPTREVADLGIPLARSQQRERAIAYRVNPQIDALNKQLKGIDRAMRELDKQARQAEKAAKQREEARRRQIEQQNRIMEAQLDALNYANLLARHAFERQQEQMDDLIAANKKAFSDLEANFLKANENFQKQINVSVGQGDSATALALVEQQRAATRAFRGQRTSFQDQNFALEQQKKAAERAEAERQRQAQLAEAQLEQQQKAIKASQDNTEALDESTEAIDNQKDSLESQKDAIQDQIDGLNAQKEAQAENTARIQETIDLYQSQTEILKAMAVAADKTLLTQEEQWQLGMKLIDQISRESGLVRDLSGNYEKYIPEVVEANKQFHLMNEAARVLTDEAFRKSLIDAGINPAVERFKILQMATDELTASQKKAATDIQNSGVEAKQAIADWQSAQEKILADSMRAQDRILSDAENDIDAGASNFKIKMISNADKAAAAITKFVDGLKSLPHKIKDFLGLAEGGFTPKNGGPIPAILHPNELVLPLSNKSRTNELLSQIGNVTVSAAAQIASPKLSSTYSGTGLSVQSGTGGGTTGQFGQLGYNTGAADPNAAATQLAAFNRMFNTSSSGLQGQTGTGGQTGDMSQILGSKSQLQQAMDQSDAYAYNAYKMLFDANTPGFNAAGILDSIKASNKFEFSSAQKFAGIPSKTGLQATYGSGGGGSGFTAELAQKLDPWTQALQSINSSGGNLAWDGTSGFSGRTGGGGGGGGTLVPFGGQSSGMTVSLSPSTVASLVQSKPASSIFAPSIVATGESLETLRALVLHEVDTAFRTAMSTSARTGALLTQGIGPGVR